MVLEGHKSDLAAWKCDGPQRQPGRWAAGQSITLGPSSRKERTSLTGKLRRSGEKNDVCWRSRARGKGPRSFSAFVTPTPALLGTARLALLPDRGAFPHARARTLDAPVGGSGGAPGDRRRTRLRRHVSIGSGGSSWFAGDEPGVGGELGGNVAISSAECSMSSFATIAVHRLLPSAEATGALVPLRSSATMRST